MAGKVLNINEIHKINSRAKMNKSAKNLATAHTLDRCTTFEQKWILKQ